ncbi:hypothetical protein SHIRM173S_08242 [Streptomyces hirsutus]
MLPVSNLDDALVRFGALRIAAGWLPIGDVPAFLAYPRQISCR